VKKFLVWAFVLSAVVAGGLTIGALMRPAGSPQPQPPELRGIPQTATAESGGVLIRAESASFSATETVLRLTLSETDAATLRQVTGGAEVSAIVPARDGFDPGGWAGYVLEAHRTRTGEVLVRLPAFVPGGSYDGTALLNVTGLTVRLPGGEVRLPGDWVLALAGPRPADLASALRLEEFEASAIEVAGSSAAVTGLRSSTETQIAVDLPASLIVLGQPTLKVGSETLAPTLVSRNGSVLTVSFPATPFGKGATFDLGAVAVPARSDTPPLTVAIGAAFRRAKLSGTEGEFAIGRDDVLSGQADMVVSGRRGSYVGRPWVSVVVQGVFHQEVSGPPTILAQDGTVLDVAHMQTGYSKDGQGNILPGVTDIAAFVGDPAKLETMTLVFGTGSVVSQGPHTAVLRP
jgi:hypothetical protein